MCPRPFSVSRPKWRCEGSPEGVTVSTLALQKPGPGPLPGQLRPRPSWKWEAEGGGRSAWGWARHGEPNGGAHRWGAPVQQLGASSQGPRECVRGHLNPGYGSVTSERPHGTALATSFVKRAFLITDSLHLMSTAVFPNFCLHFNILVPQTQQAGGSSGGDEQGSFVCFESCVMDSFRN